MRGGLSTIQQTLTPDAASVLNQSIAEAGKRNHGQTTPLHVAATLLASPSGFLRQACTRSHPNSSHPLQCRALELCFSVALERLPTAQNMSPGTDPPISNALMAALKRAQAHQRRGCPEQQQQPLLAVKVELEQLIMSILDDPGVSRVMREASFSSPAVKATIEQTISNSTSSSSSSPSTTSCHINNNINNNNIINSNAMNSSSIGIGGFRPSLLSTTPISLSSSIQLPVPSRNMYLNPRLQQANSGKMGGGQRNEDVKKVVDILLRSGKKRNPVLVGETEPEAVVSEVLRRIESGEFGEGPLKNVKVVAIDKELRDGGGGGSDKGQMVAKCMELGGMVEDRIRDSDCGGVVLALGDLKWLVGIGVPGSGVAQQQVVSENARKAVAEMAKVIARFADGSSGRLWLIGTATCETYLRCQVYHPSMENDWDLQAVPIASRSPLPGRFPSLGTSGILSSSVESLNPFKSLSNATAASPRLLSENLDPSPKLTCCPLCLENYEQELAKIVAKESDKSASEIKTEAARQALPQWLQNAKVHPCDIKATKQSELKDQELFIKHKSELQKKWTDICLQFHPNYPRSLAPERITPTALSMTGLGLYNPKLLACQPFQSKPQQTRNLGNPLQLNPHQNPTQPFQPKLHQTRKLGEPLQLYPKPVDIQSSLGAASPPPSPVRTELALGPTIVTENSAKKTNEEPVVKDFLGCISSVPHSKFNQLLNDKFADAFDADSFKKLLKGLMEKAWWQPEAASAVATTVTQCKLGHGKQRNAGSKGTIWLLFTGPDRVGKKKMASVLSEHVCGTNPAVICLGSRRDDVEFEGFRGKTALDRIAEAVQRNPNSVILLEDIDEADMLVRGNIRRAMERGRLTDSHGREISLGNVIFILTGDWSTGNVKTAIRKGCFLDEKKLASLASRGWQLRLTKIEKSGKRRGNWLEEAERRTRARKELGSALCLDLNQEANVEDDRNNGSNNSSDLTNDREDELGLDDGQISITTAPQELVSSVDAEIVFKQANFGFICREIDKTITQTSCTVVHDEKLSVEVEEEALQKILAGLWFGRTSLQEWAERVLVPTFRQLKSHGLSDQSMAFRLESSSLATGKDEDFLPSRITVTVDGA